MAQYKKSTTVKANYKNIVINDDGAFMDWETGEVYDMVSDLRTLYEDKVFSLTTTNKVDEDIEL